MSTQGIKMANRFIFITRERLDKLEEIGCTIESVFDGDQEVIEIDTHTKKINIIPKYFDEQQPYSNIDDVIEIIKLREELNVRN